jgi:endonuclease III
VFVNLSERYQKVLEYFRKHAPSAETELNYTNPYELLVAVILSAQCTDKRVNQITPALFVDYPNAESLATATPEVIFTYIRSVSYPNNKAKHLAGMARMLVHEFNSRVPDALEDLVKLPGVGRKTANVIASVVYDKPAMAVDTHVFRVSNRIGLTRNVKTPLQSELQLVKHIPKEWIPKAHHWLILHGRYICLARKPKCELCGIQAFCQYYSTLYTNNIPIKTVKPKISDHEKEIKKSTRKKSGQKKSS